MIIQEHILHLITQYGYIGILVVLILGIVGLPLPDEFILTFAGYLVSKGELSYVLTLVISLIGSLIGMSISYVIGRRLGYPFLRKYGHKIRITPEKLQKVEGWFNRMGKYTIMIGYFVPGVRHFTAYFAGISKWTYASFLSFAIPGAIAWVFTFITLGHYLGEHWLGVSENIHRYMLIFVLVLAVVLLFWLVYRYWFAKRRGNLQG